jgi:hypothetical protein
MRIVVGRFISFLAVILMALNHVYAASIPFEQETKCDNQLKFSKQVVNSSTNTFYEEEEEEQLENNYYIDYQYNDFNLNPFVYFLNIENKWVNTSCFSFSSVPLWLKIRHLII